MVVVGCWKWCLKRDGVGEIGVLDEDGRLAIGVYGGGTV